MIVEGIKTDSSDQIGAYRARETSQAIVRAGSFDVGITFFASCCNDNR
jgi:hypothetical protein